MSQTIYIPVVPTAASRKFIAITACYLSKAHRASGNANHENASLIPLKRVGLYQAAVEAFDLLEQWEAKQKTIEISRLKHIELRANPEYCGATGKSSQLGNVIAYALDKQNNDECVLVATGRLILQDGELLIGRVDKIREKIAP